MHHCNTVVDHRIDGWFRTAELFYTSQILFFDVFPHRKGEYFSLREDTLVKKGDSEDTRFRDELLYCTLVHSFAITTTFFVPLN